LIFEGLEDVEGRFFAPQVKGHHLLERVQAKSGALSPADVSKVLDNFLTFEEAYPGRTRAFTLATPTLPSTLRFIARDLKRVRLASAFYGPLRDVQDASDSKVLADLTASLGASRAGLLFERGQVDLRGLASVDEAASAFNLALSEAFTLDLSPSRLRRAFHALAAYGQSHRGQVISRLQIVTVIEAELGGTLRPPGPFRVHLVGDREDVAPPDALVIDAAALSGAPGRYAAAESWADDLQAPLTALTAWLHGAGRRRVALSGAYRLTTGFLVGAHFRSAQDFELEIDTKSGPWRTDDHPERETATPRLITRPALTLRAGKLQLAIGVLRGPEAVLLSNGVNAAEIALAQTEDAVPTGRDLQALVRAIKAFVDVEVNRLRPEGIELYFVGPAAMAVALGHRWNAMPATQLFEYDADQNSYRPTARLARHP